MTSDIALSVCPQVACRLAHSTSFPLSGVSAATFAAASDAVPLANPPVNVPVRDSHDSATSD